MSSELKYFMVKLQAIETGLGGNTNGKKALAGKSKDEFKNGEIKVLDTIRFIQKKQDERDEKTKDRTDFGTIKLGTEIRSKIAELKNQIFELERTLIRQRSNPKKFKPEDISSKEKRLKNYRTHHKIFDNRERGDLAPIMEEPIPMTLDQLKLQIINDKSTYGDIREEDMSEEEIKALNDFAGEDQKIDKLAGEIDDRLGDLRIKVNNMGEAIDHTAVQIDEANADVSKANKSLMTTNMKLKVIVQKYRSPNKFCLDIICLMLLLGLAVVLYNQLKK